MKMAFRNFLRNRRVTLISAAAVLAMAVFLMVFANSIRLNREELDAAYAHLEVNAHITGKAALADPVLPEATYKAMLDSGYIASHQAMIQHKQSGTTALRGLNGVEIDTLLRDALPYTQWQEGYDETLLQGRELVCIAPASRGHELGENVTMCLGSFGDITLKVAALYQVSYDDNPGLYYCPLGALEDHCHANGIEINYNGMEMLLQNLETLDDFKAQMVELKLDRSAARLVVNDALLRSVTSQLRRQIRLLESVMPVLLALVAGIGFGLSFLLLRGRKKEAAVMRSLGMTRKSVFSVLLLENAFQALLGGLLGSLLVVLLLGAEVLQLQYVALLVGCYLIGGGFAIWKLSGVNVFTIMTARE